MDNTVQVICKMDSAGYIIKVLRVVVDKGDVERFIRKRKFENDGSLEILRAFTVPAGLEDMLEEANFAF